MLLNRLISIKLSATEICCIRYKKTKMFCDCFHFSHVIDFHLFRPQKAGSEHNRQILRTHLKFIMWITLFKCYKVET